MSTERDLVAEACQALAAQGLAPSLGGHVSIRVPGEEQYWTTGLDRALGEVTPDDVVLLDFDGNVLEGTRLISPGITFHSGIYKLRPDVGSIVHTHGFWVTAQSVFGRPPKVYNNLSAFFYGRTAVAADDDIESIAPALKAEDVAIVLPCHGAITVGKDVAEAAALHFLLDYACRLDVTLEPTGAPEMSDEARDAILVLLAETTFLDLTWEHLRRQVAQPSALA
jgi:ribulose-5-phosphate 4-epimerase/fuculose-1-phosphate aldolase